MARKDVAFEYIRTDRMVADALTKPYGLRKVLSLMFGTLALQQRYSWCCEPCDQARCATLQQAMPE